MEQLLTKILTDKSSRNATAIEAVARVEADTLPWHE